MAANEKERSEIVYEIKRHIGVLASYPTGWRKAAPKYDLRDWDPEHKHMSRGITLHKDEMKALNDMLAAEKF